MKVIIVGVIERRGWIAELQRALPDATCYMDCANSGALHSHTQALKVAEATGERCIIMEDDAIPVVGFADKAQAWCDRFPDDLISFYLGTGRPVSMQGYVDDLIARTDTDFIAIDRLLLHGVCYSLPVAAVSGVLERLRQMDGHIPEADYAVGAGFGGRVIYPVESLVDHRDQGSAEKHPDGEARNEIRVARKLAAPLAYDR